MLHVFNRRELLITYDLRQINNLREILRANRIDYQVKASYARSPFSSPAGRTRTAYFGSASQQERYTVYVHKADWERAMYLLRQI